MSNSHDFFVLNDGEWRIDYRGNQFGPYRTYRMAVVAATAAALKAASVGDASQVLVEDENGEFQMEWASDAELLVAAV